MGFKDMMKTFLYEDVNDEDEYEEEEESEEISKPKESRFSRKKAKAAETAEPEVKSEPVQAPASPTPAEQPVVSMQSLQSATVQPEPVMSQEDLQAYYTEPKLSAPAAGSVPAASENGFLSRIDSVIETEQEQPQNESQAHLMRHRAAMRSASQKALQLRSTRTDYSTVISPIFGNIADDEKDPDALHDAINLPKPMDGIEMVEIISPMYGSNKETTRKKSGLKVTKAAKEEPAGSSKGKKAAPKPAHEEYPEVVEAAENLLPAVEEPELIEAASETETAPADLGSYLSRGTKPAKSSKPSSKTNRTKKGGYSK